MIFEHYEEVLPMTVGDETNRMLRKPKTRIWDVWVGGWVVVVVAPAPGAGGLGK